MSLPSVKAAHRCRCGRRRRFIGVNPDIRQIAPEARFRNRLARCRKRHAALEIAVAARAAGNDPGAGQRRSLLPAPQRLLLLRRTCRAIAPNRVELAPLMRQSAGRQ